MKNTLDWLKGLCWFFRKSFERTRPILLMMLLASSVSFAQNADRLISGAVFDENGTPMPGVSILVIETSIGTQTDADGKFQLAVPADKNLLRASFIGYTPQDITVGAQSSFTIKMEPDIASLQEVVVVGYGVQRRESVVSAVTTVNPTALRTAAGNITNSLAGRVSGVIAYQTSGEPGLGTDNSQFYIRGLSSFGSGKVDPLILIDNVESSPVDLARLQTDDIASFSVLKDASAAAVYGSRGANGVILITTKLGVPGKTKFNFRAENTVSTNTKNYQLTDNISYMRDANEAALRTNSQLPYSENKIAHTLAGDDPYLYPNNNWIKELIRPYTVNQRYNLNVSGGDEKSSYYIAGTYNTDNGILKVDPINDFNSNIKLRNYSVRSNVTVDFTKTTEFTLRLYGQFDDYTGPVGGGAATFRNSLSANPVMFPAVYPKSKLPYVNHPLFGSAITMRGGLSIPPLYVNPYAELVKGYQTYKTSNFNPQIEIKQDLSFIAPGLSANVMTYLQRYSYYSVARSYQPFYYRADLNPLNPSEYTVSVMNDGGPGSPESWTPGTEYLNWPDEENRPKVITSKMYLQGSLNYAGNFKKHEVTGLLTGFVSSFESGNASTVTASLPQRNTVLAGRATYGYDTRYLFEFNFGYNGSERFARNNRYGFFPSVGVAYNISKENFFQPLTNAISDLKLRASYGLVGNDQVGDINDRFLYLSDISANDPFYSAQFGTQQGTPMYSRLGYAAYRFGNDNVGWEISKQLNLGVDVTLFKSLSFIVNAFKTDRSNMYLPNTNVEMAQGLIRVPSANYGSGETKGIDVSMVYNKQVSDFNFTLSGTFTYATSKVLKTAELEYGPELSHLKRRGQPFRQAWGYVAERLFIDDEEVENSPIQNFDGQSPMAGDIKYRDITGDGIINTDDMVPIGYPTVPEIVYGVGPSVTYKRWDFGFMFQGSARSTFFIDPVATAPFIEFQGWDQNGNRIPGAGYQTGELQAIHEDHWSEENPDPYAFWPRLSDQLHANNIQPSTWWMRNGSFIRLKTVTLGYSFRSISKLANARPRVYFSANNLFAVSKFDLWDVEMGGNGLGYPVQRVYMLGVQIDL